MSLEGTADTTWNVGSAGEKDVYALALTHNGGCVYAELKSLPPTSCSAEAESLGSIQVSHRAVQGRSTLQSLGVLQTQPTTLLGDCEPSLRAMEGAPAVGRLRHAMRRWAIVTARCQTRETRLAHVTDPWNWVDFMTKWVDQAKVERSLFYLYNVRARREHPAEGDRLPSDAFAATLRAESEA
jgi:hypothetical protein